MPAKSITNEDILHPMQDFMQMTSEGFVRLDSKIDGLETRMDGLEGKMVNLEARMSGIEGTVHSIEKIVGRIENEQTTAQKLSIPLRIK